MSLALRLRLLPLLAVPALLASSPARAQDSTDNSATVEALFGAGKSLAAQGKFSEACPKFLASYNLEHRIGTLLNLADCYEKNQQLASAWARYVEASTLAQRAGQAERYSFAVSHAKALEPTLSRLTVTVADATGAHSVAGPAGLVVRRDGVAVDAGAYGVAVAVDGGTHTIEASAPGKKPWSSQIALTASADAKTVIVPALEDGPQPLDATQSGATPDAPGAHGIGPLRLAGFVVGGAGVAGLVVGSIVGAMASSKASSAKKECVPAANCQLNTNPAASTDMSSAGSLADVSTVAFIAGGALVATGVVLVLVGGPKKSPAALQVTPTVVAHGGGMGISGAW